MLKATYWISVASVPILLVSAGCSIGPRPFSTARRGLPPDRLMAMARTFERQGHYSQAKNAYLQVLASQPDYPDARQSLETLIANESNPEGLKRARNALDQKQMLAQAKATAEREAREIAAHEQERSATPATSRSTRASKFSSDSIERSRDSRTDTRVVSASESISGSRKPIADPDDTADNAPYAKIRPADSRSSHDVASNASERDELADTFASEADSNSASVFESPVIGSQKPKGTDAFVANSSKPASSRQSQIESDSRDSTLDVNDLLAQQPVVAPDESSGTTASSAEIVDGPDSFATPEGVAHTDSAGAALSTEVADSIQFEQPIIRDLGIHDREIEPFFGPFHSGMVQDVRKNRDQFQSKLLELASDQDADVEVRSRAVFLLGSIGPEAAEVLPSLRREMHYDVDEYLRVDLCEAILKIRPEDEDAIKVLVESLKETDENLRWIAAFALRNAVSPRTTFVIDSLLASLNTQDLKLRRMIFLTLAEFGTAAEKAIPELEAALESPDAATREVAKASLACIAPDRKTTQVIQKTSLNDEFTAKK